MISIIIPTKNEPYVKTLVKRINKFVKEDKEIIVVDKSDKKPNVDGARIISQKSNGLGNAVMEGLENSKGDIIIIMDGDGSHRPEDIKQLLSKLGHYDMVIGSRFIADARTEDISHRKLISLLFRKLTSLILNIKVQDNMSGFSAMKREIFNRIKLKPKGYKINLEIMYKAKVLGYKICEVPIIFEKRKAGKSNVGLNSRGVKEVMNILILMLRLRFIGN